MKKTLALVLALVLVFTLGIAASVAESNTTAAFKIGVSMKTMSDAYSNKLGTDIETYAAATYPGCQLVLLDAKADIATQISQVEDLIAQKCDVIILNAQDADGSGECVVKCKEAGIPCVEVNASTKNTDYVSYIGSNDVEAGEIMGNFIMGKLGEAGGQIAILEGNMGQSAQIDRYQGLTNTILAQANIECVYTITCDWQRDTALSTTEDILARFPDLKALCCENDDMAMGALQACEANNRSDVIICGIDAIDDALQAVKDGRLDATILQDHAGQAQQVIDVAVKVAAGEQVESLYYIPFVLITSDNIGDYLK
ncbi:MAG: substrate-binding domain-containing protein [Clostridiales bacterium]|nr:substrate-binding domain-containing protein [Clostridiales bacterium]